MPVAIDSLTNFLLPAPQREGPLANALTWHTLGNESGALAFRKEKEKDSPQR